MSYACSGAKRHITSKKAPVSWLPHTLETWRIPDKGLNRLYFLPRFDVLVKRDAKIQIISDTDAYLTFYSSSGKGSTFVCI